MKEPLISLFASAARPQFWSRFYNSLVKNQVPFEICFVGPEIPTFGLPANFHFQYSKCKPSQCYEAAARMCKGVLIGWTADDANYNHHALNSPRGLDAIWDAYTNNDSKIILAQRTIEDGNDVSESHRFFFGKTETPRMAPLGFINRELFMTLRGYDQNFICGQAENDIVMRARNYGSEVILLDESKVYLHHSECHGVYNFRAGYNCDREYLEKCWVKEGYGTFEQNKPFTLSETRQLPFMPFKDENLLTINQGPAGSWTQ